MDTPQSYADLLRDFEARKPRALARAISHAESGRGRDLVRALFTKTGRAMTIGLTGPPGVGKSTLASGLVRKARALGKSVGVVSVDPSSPFSHGALLGDRIRLSEHFTDESVFIRSMASRGHLGGLSGATADAVLLMDAFGLDVIVIETVGVGQSEVAVAELAQTTLVALQPGSGDSIQVLKAGIMEIADVFVVNKSDHPMADQLRREIRSMMEMLQFTRLGSRTGRNAGALRRRYRRTLERRRASHGLSQRNGRNRTAAPRRIRAPSAPARARAAGAADSIASCRTTRAPTSIPTKRPIAFARLAAA